jgi:cytoskeletal protein CcmA (bactofilin family)
MRVSFAGVEGMRETNMFQSKNGSNGARERDGEQGYVPSIPDAGGAKSDDLVRHLKPSYERGLSAAPAGPRQGGGGQTRSLGDGVLIIGAGVEVRGTIASCDELVVEGKVESTIECRVLTVAETGTVKGEATVQELEVHGVFDGKAGVSGCLTVKSTGRVTGEIRYGQLEVERGGIVSGELATVAVPDETPERSPTKNAEAVAAE